MFSLTIKNDKISCKFDDKISEDTRAFIRLVLTSCAMHGNDIGEMRRKISGILEKEGIK